ncbi:hypothetical protein KDX09_10400 [Burkholderia cenocepacia]|uniref:hypothetical protein n=1 Tax=Burkholderia cenocepacia TaxID=95486 RepID=UPI001BA226AC|nr:hypothetical protein [Burkholderia cenocepacia]MBR8089806.1 hypothetical protein [Burkholderia cenocepacia]
MGKLVESSQWEEDLYEIEVSDPVEGGPDGVSNKQAKQLGGRTRYLKAQVEQSQTGLAQHIAAADPHTQYATKTDLAARLAALVGQSPQTLDTLKELADALGNDPNFATSIANQLGLKAPIDSPNLTGTPKGTTAGQFDNSTRLATTAFVKAAGESFSNVIGLAGSSTLGSNHVGAFLWAYGGGTLTLPPVAGIPAGATITIAAVFGTNVKGNASEQINNQFSVAANTFALNAGEQAQFVSNGGAWFLTSYTTVLGVTPAQFDGSKRLATTEFVQQAAGNFQSRKYITGSSAIAVSDTGSWFEVAAAGPTTLTLPAPTTNNLVYTITGVASNGTAVTIATPSGSIYNQASASSTFSLDAGATVELVSDASNWTVISHYTRSPIAQTPALPDGSARVATTSFVKSWLQGVTTTTGVSANTTLNASAFGQAVIVTGGTPTITLPAANAGVNGQGIVIVNDGGPAAGYATVAAAGGDVISNVGPSINLALGESLVLVTNGSQWWPIGGTAMLKKTQRVLINTVVDDGSSALQVGGIAKAATPAAGDSSTSLATTAFANSVGSVVGSVRNGQMSVAAASASATFTADEIVVETALGGAPIRIANFNNTINIAASGGPGGMDTGNAPANGYVAIYAIYNPTSGASALLATNATNAKAPEVYGGANMPAGMKASALVSVWPTNSSGQFIPAFQRDRRLDFRRMTAATTTSPVPEFAAVSVASIIPKNATSCSGWLQVSCQATSASVPAFNAVTGVSSDGTGIGYQQFATANPSTTTYTYVGMFRDLQILTAQTIYWASAVGSGTFNSGTFMISGYSF